MKLIKKMLAIMFAFMMVVGMGAKVNAEGTESTTATTGKITIGNAVDGQTYSIYKVLELESYDKDKGLYSYKPAADWNSFFDSTIDGDTGKPKGAGSVYITIDSNGYATWIAGTTDADKATFAKLALEYAKTNNINYNEKKNAEGNTVTFDNLPLGYYLVDSSVGALCNLTTTASNATINEKNGQPTVDKTVYNDKDWVKKNSVNIGDAVTFKTDFTISKGAHNYTLHDKMDSNLEFLSIQSIQANKKTHPSATGENPSYTLVTNNLDDGCTFHLVFNQSYLDQLDETYTIELVYFAKVKDTAQINTPMKNTTWLTYGEQNTPTIKLETNTYTFGIPVFKYTGNNKQPLAGAKFTLYTDESCAADKALKFSFNDTTKKYRYDADATKGSEILKSLENTGRVDIEGIKAGTYYLKEIEAPKGYNKLASPITIVIAEDGKVTSNGFEVTTVNVENKTGTLLPSTGGMGTTIIYMAGAILVVASGIVLVSKKKSKAK